MSGKAYTNITFFSRPFVNPFDAVRDSTSPVSSQDLELPQSLNVVLKKVLKRDLKTRIRGFVELTEWIGENDDFEGLAVHIIKVHERYAFDPEHRVRVALYEVMSKCTESYGKKFFSNVIKQVLFGLIGALYDPIATVASAARHVFTVLFPKEKTMELCTFAHNLIFNTILELWDHGIQDVAKRATIEGYSKEDIEWIQSLSAIYINNNLAFLVKNTGKCEFIREHQNRLVQSTPTKDAYVRRSLYQLAKAVYDRDTQLASHLSSFAFKDVSPITGDACLDLAVKFASTTQHLDALFDFPKTILQYNKETISRLPSLIAIMAKTDRSFVTVFVNKLETEMIDALSQNEARNLVMLDTLIKCKLLVDQPLDQLIEDLLVTGRTVVSTSPKDLVLLLVNNQVDLTPFVTPSLSEKYNPELLTEFSRHGLLDSGTAQGLFSRVATLQELTTLTALVKFQDRIEFNNIEPTYEAFEILLKWSNDFDYAFGQVKSKIQTWNTFWDNAIEHDGFNLFAANSDFIDYLKSLNQNHVNYTKVFAYLWNSEFDASLPSELTMDLVSKLNFLQHKESSWDLLRRAVILDDATCNSFIEKARLCPEFPSLLITRHCKPVMSEEDFKMIQVFSDLTLEWPVKVTEQLLDAVYVEFDLPNTIYSFISTFNKSFQITSNISSNKACLLRNLQFHMILLQQLYQHIDLECVLLRLLQDLENSHAKSHAQATCLLHNSWTDLLVLMSRMDEDIKVGSLNQSDAVDVLQQALSDDSTAEDALRVSAMLTSNPKEAKHHLEECLLSESVNLVKLLSVINLCCQNRVKPFTLRSSTISMVLSKHPPNSVELIKFINHASKSTAVSDEFWMAIDPSFWMFFREGHGEFERTLLNEAIAFLYERNLQIVELEEHATLLWKRFLSTADVTLCRFAGAYGVNNGKKIDLSQIIRMLQFSDRKILLTVRFLFNVLLDRTLVELKTKLSLENLSCSTIFPWSKDLFTSVPHDLICIDMLLLMAEGCREDSQMYNMIYSVFRDELSTPIFEHVLRSLLEAGFDPSCHEFSVVDVGECDDRLLILANLYYRLLRSFPTACRLWFDTLPKDLQTRVEDYTRSHFSRIIINRELDRIRRRKTVDALILEIEQSSTTLIIVAKYAIEDFGMQLRLSMPPSFPLKAITIVGSERLGLPETKWRTWLLACQSVFSSQSFNGSIVDGLTLWSLTVSRSLEGIDPCPICYCILHPGDRTLPTPTCHTCKKKYHSACLYKWFKTGGQSTCPMCRSLF